MRNSEISKILFEAGNKTSKLWDLPRPKWTEKDFDELERIRTNKKKRSEYFDIDRKIKNTITGKKYVSVKSAAKFCNVSIFSIYNSCNGIIKGKQKFIYVYEKTIKSETKNK